VIGQHPSGGAPAGQSSITVVALLGHVIVQQSNIKVSIEWPFNDDDVRPLPHPR